MEELGRYSVVYNILFVKDLSGRLSEVPYLTCLLIMSKSAGKDAGKTKEGYEQSISIFTSKVFCIMVDYNAKDSER